MSIKKAKAHYKIARKYLKDDQGDLPIHMNLRFADIAAKIAIAEELAKTNIKLDNLCYELKSAREGERK